LLRGVEFAVAANFLFASFTATIVNTNGVRRVATVEVSGVLRGQGAEVIVGGVKVILAAE
jgi:hypothetical protein